MTYHIAGIPFPDAATAAAYYSESLDMDEYADMFPTGFSELLAWLRFNHPDLTADDITTLAAAVHEHATRPDQDIPEWKSLRDLARGIPVHIPKPRPAWEHPTDSLAALPPALHTTPATFMQRVRRIFTHH